MGGYSGGHYLIILIVCRMDLQAVIGGYIKQNEDNFSVPSFCDPGGIRTPDPQIRNLLLYPTELLDQSCIPFCGEADAKVVLFSKNAKKSYKKVMTDM